MPDKLSRDDLMICFSGAPERETHRERESEREREATTDKMMKVFEAAKAAARVITKGMIFMKESRGERGGGPGSRP